MGPGEGGNPRASSENEVLEDPGFVGEQEEGTEVKGKKLKRPQLGFRKSLERGRDAAANCRRESGTLGRRKARDEGRGGSVGGACCHSLETPPLGQPPSLPLENAGGGSEEHPPLATGPRPAPCPPTPSDLPGYSEHRERKHPGCHNPLHARKAGPQPPDPTAW